MIVFTDKQLRGISRLLREGERNDEYVYESFEPLYCFRHFLRDRGFKARERIRPTSLRFGISSCADLPPDFFDQVFSRICSFSEDLHTNLGECISTLFLYVWNYILGFDPKTDQLDRYLEEFGRGLDPSFVRENKKILDRIRNALSEEIRKESEIKNIYSWHINELLMNQIYSDEWNEVIDFRRTHKISPHIPPHRRKKDYADAVILRISRFLKTLQRLSLRNCPLLSPNNYEDEVAQKLLNEGLYGLRDSYVSCPQRDLVVIMNRKMSIDLANYSSLRLSDVPIVVVNELPYGCVKIGSKYRYNNLAKDGTIRFKVSRNKDRLEFSYDQSFDFFINPNIPFLCLRIFGLEEKLMPKE